MVLVYIALYSSKAERRVSGGWGGGGGGGGGVQSHFRVKPNLHCIVLGLLVGLWF